MTSDNTATDRGTLSARMRALEAGTASLPDVAWAAMRGNLARKFRRSVTEGADGPLRGVLGVAFGVAVLVWPEVSLALMVAAFAVYALVDGVLSVLGLIAGRRTWRLAVESLAGLAAGGFALAQPGASRLALLYVLALWVVVMGALRLRAAIEITDRFNVRWTAAILAVLAITAGSTVLVDPGLGHLGLMINIAVFPILNGVTQIAASRAG